MKPEIARGVRRLVPRRRRARGRQDSTDGLATTPAGWPPLPSEDPFLDFESTAYDGADLAADGDAGMRLRRSTPASDAERGAETFDPAEFAEFLEADDSPLPANPAFKERLRQQLWGMVRDNVEATKQPEPTRIGDRPRRRRPGPNPKLPS